jgi:hypothetical protein
MTRSRIVVVGVFALAFLLTAQGVAAQTTYTLKVSTDSSSYIAGQSIKITGSVSPAPGPSTGVTLKVVNPSGTVVAVGEADVGASSGSYNYTLVAGGSSGWTTGTYTVNATWGAYAPQIYAQAKFSYSPTAVTTTSSTTTSISSITTTMTTTTTQTSTTSSSAGGGGIPVFPFEGVFTLFFAAVVLSAYLIARRSAARGPKMATW